MALSYGRRRNNARSDFLRSTWLQLKPRIREVLFLDTADFRFYNNAFILRRRTTYEDGFPVGDPEIVFKFRHPDLHMAAAVDVRPTIPGSYQIKFKAEALPLHDQLGGYRFLYSHNVQFGLSQASAGDQTSMLTLARMFPALEALKKSDSERVELVNQAIVEEVLQDLGTLDFGKAVAVDSDVALWRTRGEHKSLVGGNSLSNLSSSVAATCRRSQWSVASSFTSSFRKSHRIGSRSARPRQQWSIG